MPLPKDRRGGSLRAGHRRPAVGAGSSRERGEGEAGVRRQVVLAAGDELRSPFQVRHSGAMRMVVALLLLCLAMASNARSPNAVSAVQNGQAVSQNKHAIPNRPLVPIEAVGQPQIPTLNQAVSQANLAANENARSERNYQAPCNPDEERRDSDLCAQWRAADAARDTAFYSKWQLIVGLVSAVGIIAALGLTIWTNRLVVRSVQVAQGTERAYLSFKPPEKFLEGSGSGWAFKMHLENVGATPARTLETYVNMLQVLPLDADAYFQEANFTSFVETIPSGGHQAFLFALPVDRKEGSFFVYEVRYRDIFGVKHISRRTVRLDQWGRTWSPAGSEKWNRED